MSRWFRSLALQLLRMGMFAVGLLLATVCLAADPANIEISMRLDNISGFSTKAKTYEVDGTIWLAYDAELAQVLQTRDIKPIDLIRFQNLINPWDSTIQLLTERPVKLPNGKEFRGYSFAGMFYSNEIDYRSFPFGGMTLAVVVEPRVGAADLLDRNIRLVVAPDGAELGSRAGLSGYDLGRWAFFNEAYTRNTSILGGAAAVESRVAFNVYYDANIYAAAVKWVLPLAVVMLIMLLTPSLTSSLVSERLSVPAMILLSIALMQQSYRENLPAIPYLTFLDKLYAYSFIVTLVVFLIFIWAANALKDSSTADRLVQAKRINRVDLATQVLAIVGYIGIVVITMS
jgi:hypothetical protein